MRLWSLHPKYLDARGLVALWREALLARAVLRGKTRGYRNHPQLQRFLSQRSPVGAINAYLAAVHVESVVRGYSFNRRKIGPESKCARIVVTDGQVRHEWRHLMRKLSRRDPGLHRKWRGESTLQCHSSFRVRAGAVETWERVADAAKR